MIKVLINRAYRTGPWGGGANFVNAFFDHAKEYKISVTTSLADNPDIILMIDPRYDELGLSANELVQYSTQKNIPLLQRINECDARKGTTDIDKMLLSCSKHLTHSVFVSNWLQYYHMSNDNGWYCNSNSVIYNGVDSNIFRPGKKLNNQKVNIVAHHWSDNRLKGADIYEEIDKFVGANKAEFTFTYIGRHKCNFAHTNVIQPLYGKALGDELGRYDIYVSASRYDPGPNHICEPISCELPTYVHTCGGGAVEFAGQDHIYNDWNELKSLLLSKTFFSNSTQFKSWNDCIKQYADLMRQLIR